MTILKKFSLLVGFLTLSGCTMTSHYEQPISSVIPASIIPYSQDKQDYDNLMSKSFFAHNVKVGMLIPLSGAYAQIGQSLQEAGQMAQFDIADDHFILQFYDTKGTAEGAEEAFERAAAAGVSIILGPVFAYEVDAIRRPARRKGIPVVSFTSNTEEVSEGVYTLALTIPNQIERAVRHACELGKTHLAILTTDDEAGDFAIDTAKETAKKCGMQITTISVYNPTFINFEPYVLKTLPPEFAEKKVLEKQKKKEKKTAEPEQEQIPIAEQIDFDALLIADDGNRLKSIASLFALYDVTPRDVLFIGTSTWQDPSLTLEGALAGAHFAALPTDGYDSFTKKYVEIYGKKPIRLASLAYDAVALVSVLAQTDEVNDDGLTNPYGFAGTDGLFRLGENGIPERLLGISEIVSRNRFRVVERPAQTFEKEEYRKQNLNNIREVNEQKMRLLEETVVVTPDQINAQIKAENEALENRDDFVDEADVMNTPTPAPETETAPDVTPAPAEGLAD